MKAEEAFKIAISNTERALTYELEKIYKDIKLKAEQGNVQIVIDENITLEARKHLESNGYKVKVDFHRNESYTTISWDRGYKNFNLKEI